MGRGFFVGFSLVFQCFLFKTNNALTFGNAPEAGFLALVVFAKDLKAEEGFIRVFSMQMMV